MIFKTDFFCTLVKHLYEKIDIFSYHNFILEFLKYSVSKNTPSHGETVKMKEGLSGPPACGSGGQRERAQVICHPLPSPLSPLSPVSSRGREERERREVRWAPQR
jgi:hypothetical protein